MTKPNDTIEKGVHAALELAGQTSWAALTLAEIAKAASLELSDFHGVADKAALADAVEPVFDKAMSAEAVDMDEAPRARLFEAIMLRFEAMEDYRPGLLSLMSWREASPARLASLLAARRQSAEWALASAAYDGSEAVPLSVKALNVGWAMARAERAWRKDKGPDFTRTMATLDKELRHAEERIAWFERLRKGRPARRRGASWRFADDADDIKPSETPGQDPAT